MQADIEKNEEIKDDEEGYGKITETLILSPGSRSVKLIAKTHSLAD